MPPSLSSAEPDRGATSSAPPVSVAYLVSQYPLLSMIFVLREVLALRRLGLRIDVASINDVDRLPEHLTADERAEAGRTHYVLAEGIAGALTAHLRTLWRSPRGYLRGWALVVGLGRLDLARLFKNTVYFTESLMVGRWMQRRGHHHLHVHLGSQAASVGLFAKTVFGHGYSMTVHGPDEFYAAAGQYLTEKMAAADFVVGISHFACSQLMKLSPYDDWRKLHVCRLGVDPALFAMRSPPPAVAGAPFEILCIGRLTPAKGQHLLIDAVQRLHAAGRAVRLRVVGGGPDAASLAQHVQRLRLDGVVLFEGPVNQDRIRSFYAAADCFCMPSFAEGIPVVLMEAMAMGVPCVTTHITGIPELIRDGESGLLVAPSDVVGLADVLKRLIDDPALGARLAAAGRAKVVAEYDLDRNVATLARLFDRLVGLAPAAIGDDQVG